MQNLPDGLQRLAAKIGFGKAFCQLASSLPEDIWDELSFGHCVDIYRHSNRTNPINSLALRQMKKIGSFWRWRRHVLYSFGRRHPIVEVALRAMLEHAETDSQKRRLMKDAYAMEKYHPGVAAFGRKARQAIS